METKEAWINRTMESLEGAGPQACPPDLQAKLMNSIPKGRVVRFRSPGIFWKAAAGILLLIGLNLVTIFWYQKEEADGAGSAGTAAREYFSYIDSFNL